MSLLYKFRDWTNDNHKRILTDSEIYFASPNQFNDPFDCFLIPRYDLLPEVEKLDKYKEMIALDNPHLTQSEVTKEAKKWHRLKLLDGEKFLKRAEELLMLNNARYGIFSVTKTKDPILLWSHYSNSHKGFCVGFDPVALTENIRSSFHHINIICHDVDVVYSADYPVMIPHKKITTKEYIEKPLSTKASFWSYEEEKRFILFDMTKTPLKLKPEVYSSIFLGCNISAEDKNAIIEISKSNFSGIKLFQAKKHISKYAVDFEVIC